MICQCTYTGKTKKSRQSSVNKKAARRRLLQGANVWFFSHRLMCFYPLCHIDLLRILAFQGNSDPSVAGRRRHSQQCIITLEIIDKMQCADAGITHRKAVLHFQKSCQISIVFVGIFSIAVDNECRSIIVDKLSRRENGVKLCIVAKVDRCREIVKLHTAGFAVGMGGCQIAIN